MSPAGRASRGAALERSAPLFAALGDPTRLRVVTRLATEGPLSITKLTEGAAVSRQAVTKHLAVLATAGVVRDFRAGREHVWELSPRPLAEASRALETISAQWDAALARLRAMVEE
jgi:DNA-binding transcriptional ArsR family regulator